MLTAPIKIIAVPCSNAIDGSVIKEILTGHIYEAQRSVYGNKIFDAGVEASPYTDLQPLHLHAVCNWIIEEGDWVMDMDDYTIERATADDLSRLNNNRHDENGGICKKVIVSTDSSLGLPKFGENLIREYEMFNGKLRDLQILYNILTDHGGGRHYYEASVAQDNTVLIDVPNQRIYSEDDMQRLVVRALTELSSFDNYVQEACGNHELAKGHFDEQNKKFFKKLRNEDTIQG